MGYLNLRPEQTNIFFKLMEERYRRTATIITTNLDYDEWHNFLGNKALVDALLSRLRHHCHTVRIDGPVAARPAGLILALRGPATKPPSGRHRSPWTLLAQPWPIENAPNHQTS